MARDREELSSERASDRRKRSPRIAREGYERRVLMPLSKTTTKPHRSIPRAENLNLDKVRTAPGSVSVARSEPAARPKTRERAVRDLMTATVFTLRPQNSLATLYDLFDSKRVRHVPIVDADGDLVGLVTERDLSRSALGPLMDLPLSAERDELRRRKIRDIMATEPDSIEPDASLKTAADMLLENKVGCLPVVEGLHLVGILTEADFVRDFLERS
jgi:CBS domain-containing membrane protein